MTTLAAAFIFALGTSFGAAIMCWANRLLFADLRAENAELREAAALDLSLAKLKATVEEPEEDEAA